MLTCYTLPIAKAKFMCYNKDTKQGGKDQWEINLPTFEVKDLASRSELWVRKHGGVTHKYRLAVHKENGRSDETS